MQMPVDRENELAHTFSILARGKVKVNSTSRLCECEFVFYFILFSLVIPLNKFLINLKSAEWASSSRSQLFNKKKKKKKKFEINFIKYSHAGLLDYYV